MINLVKKLKPITSSFHLKAKVNTFDPYFITNGLLDYYYGRCVDGYFLHHYQYESFWSGSKRAETEEDEAVKALQR
jgi:hypothetical protein